MKCLATVIATLANESHTPYFDDCSDRDDERMALVLAHQQRGTK